MNDFAAGSIDPKAVELARLSLQSLCKQPPLIAVEGISPDVVEDAKKLLGGALAVAEALLDLAGDSKRYSASVSWALHLDDPGLVARSLALAAAEEAYLINWYADEL